MSWGVWITGLPGSGKSAVARAAAEAIVAAGEPVTLLELDEMRRLVTPAPTCSGIERDLVHRALVFVASALVDAGVPVIVDATAHRRAWRDRARAVIASFAEVQLTCPLDVCRERERTRAEGNAPPGIDAAAGVRGAGEPGVDVPYEPAVSPELTIDTTQETPAAAAARIAALAATLGRVPRRPPPARWAVWITGLPGSGKTTIARRVADALIARGTPVRVLDLGVLHELVAHVAPAPLAEEIAHRALVYAAKRLTEAGVPVIVDATAPARAWRRLARDVIAHFAEVQLVCPADVCATRERAVRWGLGGRLDVMPAARPADGPDITLLYERALRAEVTIYTDVEDLWSAAEAVLALVRRLDADSAAGETAA